MNAFSIHQGTPPPAPVRPAGTTTIREQSRTQVDTGSFQRELGLRIQPQGLTFSRHASKRLEMRGIQFTPQGLDRIEAAIDKAAEKGGRNSLVIAGALSLVVSIPNRTVVTVMNSDQMDENVITNIDSAVFA